MERLRADPRAVALHDHLAETARLSWHQGLARWEEEAVEAKVMLLQHRLVVDGFNVALLRIATVLRAEVEVVRMGRDVEML